MESKIAFGAQRGEVKNCGLRFALFAFSQRFVHATSGQNHMSIYLEVMGRQCRRPKQEVSHEHDRRIQRIHDDPTRDEPRFVGRLC